MMESIKTLTHSKKSERHGPNNSEFNPDFLLSHLFDSEDIRKSMALTGKASLYRIHLNMPLSALPYLQMAYFPPYVQETASSLIVKRIEKINNHRVHFNNITEARINVEIDDHRLIINLEPYSNYPLMLFRYEHLGGPPHSTLVRTLHPEEILADMMVHFMVQDDPIDYIDFSNCVRNIPDMQVELIWKLFCYQFAQHEKEAPSVREFLLRLAASPLTPSHYSSPFQSWSEISAALLTLRERLLPLAVT